MSEWDLCEGGSCCEQAQDIMDRLRRANEGLLARIQELEAPVRESKVLANWQGRCWHEREFDTHRVIIEWDEKGAA